MLDLRSGGHHTVPLKIPADNVATRIDFNRTGRTEGPISLASRNS